MAYALRFDGHRDPSEIGHYGAANESVRSLGKMVWRLRRSARSRSERLEQNSWFYLRTDLEEEERCAEEWQADLPALSGEFPEVTELLQRIDSDCKRHWLRFRGMLAHSDPLSAGPA